MGYRSLSHEGSLAVLGKITVIEQDIVWYLIEKCCILRNIALILQDIACHSVGHRNHWMRCYLPFHRISLLSYRASLITWISLRLIDLFCQSQRLIKCKEEFSAKNTFESFHLSSWERKTFLRRDRNACAFVFLYSSSTNGNEQLILMTKSLNVCFVLINDGQKIFFSLSQFLRRVQKTVITGNGLRVCCSQRSQCELLVV